MSVSYWQRVKKRTLKELDAILDDDIDIAKESLIDQLSPKEIENESSYDNDDITGYISDNTTYDLIIFGDKTTALLLDMTKAKFKRSKFKRYD